MTGFDVAVIGGGVHGASAAYHLTERGASVCVVEAGELAGGPTGRSSAICRAYYTNPFLAQVARDSMSMFEDFEELTGGHDAGFGVTGELYLHPPEEIEQLRATAEFLNSIGTEVECVSVDRLADLHPTFDLDGIGGAAWEPGAGYADPAGTTSGLMAAALARGAQLRTHSHVVDITAASGVSLRLAGGDRLKAAQVLIAAGPWTRQLTAKLGVDLPLSVERHLVATYEWASAEPVSFVLADVPNGFYTKPEGDAQFFVGSLWAEPEVDPDDYDEAISGDESIELIERVIRRVPELENVATRGGWASLYDVSPDWQPVIGEIADAVFVDCGSSGHGFKLAPALGRHVAGLMMGDEAEERALAQFSPQRFAAGASLESAYGSARIIG